jgi:microcystin-dependent protein
MWQGTSLPASATDGSTFFLTNEVTTGSGVTASGLYVRANGTWLPIAQNNQYVGPPVGSTIWFNGASAPTGTLVEDGSAVSRAGYPALFAAIGIIHGDGDGSTTFNLPSTIGKMVRGDVGGSVGATGGNSTVTVGISNLPSHSHTLNGHTHTLVHTHSITHNHAAANTSTTTHSHSGTTGGETSNTRAYSYGSTSTWVDDLYDFQQVLRTGTWPTSGGPGIPFYDPADGIGRLDWNNSLWTPQRYEIRDHTNHSHSITLNNGGSHLHSVDLPSYSGTSGGASATTTSGNSGNTGSTGSGTPTALNILPPYVNKLPCIVAY